MASSNRPDQERHEHPDEQDEDAGQSLLQSGREGPGGQGMIHLTPSQAEGDRDAIEEYLDEKTGGHREYASSTGIDPENVQYTPSQAEGDRETVERDLDEKEGQ